MEDRNITAEDKNVTEGKTEGPKEPQSIQTVSLEDFQKFQSAKDREIAELKKQLAERDSQLAEINQRLAQAETQEKAIREFLASQENETRSRLEASLRAAQQNVATVQQQYEAARILKAAQLTGQPGSLVTMQELLQGRYRSPEEMEIAFLRLQYERQLQRVKEEAEKSKVGKGTEGETQALTKVEVPGGPNPSGVNVPQPQAFAGKRERGRRGSVLYLEESWRHLSGQTGRKAKV